jgi:hypothetical protein
MIGHRPEQQRGDRLRERPQHGPDRLGPPPQLGRHDVEPGGVQRGVLRGQAAGRQQEDRHRHPKAAGEQGGHRHHGRRGRRHRGDGDPPGQPAPVQQRVPGRTACQYSGDGADAQAEQAQGGEALAGAVLLLHELGTERLHAREEVVAACAGDDEDHVSADPQHVPGGCQRAHPARVGSQHQFRIRRQAVVPGDPLRVGAGRGRLRRGVGGLLPRAFGRQHTLPAARRFPEPEDEPAQRERGDGEHDERRPPGQRRHVAADPEPEPGPGQLTGQDVAVDAAPFPAGEVVTDEGCDQRPSRCGDPAQHQPGEQQAGEVSGRGAPDHRQAPAADRHAECPCPPHPVSQHPERHAGHGGYQRRDGDQQTQAGVAHAQRLPQFGRGSPHGRHVGAAQAEHAGEGEDDAHPGGPAEHRGQTAGRRRGDR